MSKKPAKTKPAKDAKPAAPAAEGADTPAAGDTAAAPKKRSKLKLGLMVLVPLIVLGGGGYAGWEFYVGPTFFGTGAHADAAKADGHGDEAAAHGAETPGEDGHAAKTEGEAHAAEDGHGEADPIKVSALPLDIAAETSATHSFAIAVLIAEECGAVETPALKAASEAEAHGDGMLVSLSWQAAARRTATLSGKNCDYLTSEIEMAEHRLVAGAAPPKDAAPKH